jgi:hypothetical protein
VDQYAGNPYCPVTFDRSPLYSFSTIPAYNFMGYMEKLI